MTNAVPATIPVWMRTTNDFSNGTSLPIDTSMTPARLAELRSALAAFAHSPLATLEAHPLQENSTDLGVSLWML